ncbi:MULTISPECIES: cupin domain-containing protein [Natrialbaceae]|uniref:cupin domain-containing protein n=1 Tax=Natrialbaceae TaxID=1644061 RepID=UPI00207CD13B|nr:cupin domain-containing protein [Natronococcus sp. CG52]
MEVHSVRRPVSRTLDFTDFAMNYFELEPGESFSGGLHTHHDQEEVFYVREGVATFEIRGSQSDSDGTRGDGGSDETSEVAVREFVSPDPYRVFELVRPGIGSARKPFADRRL